MYYAAVGALAFLVHLLVNFNVIIGHSEDRGKASFRAYRLFSFAVMAFYIADVCWGLFYENGLVGWTYADTVFFFITMALSILLWTRYVIRYLHLTSKNRLLLFWTGNVFFLLLVVALGVNFFYPVLFGFDATGAYVTGPMRFITLILQVLLFLSTAVNALVIARRTRESLRRRYIAIGSVGLFMTGAIVLQLLYPLLPFYSFGCLLGTCVLEEEKNQHRRDLADMLKREQEQRVALDQALAMAHTDALTGLRNPHAYVDAQLDVDARIAKGTLTAFSVIAFDVNRLKEINDSRGHEEGDRWICAAGELIRRHFPNTPIYRVGGDEFVAILEGEDYRDRAALFVRFNEEVEKNLVAGRVVVSAGMGEFILGRDFACHAVFTRADKAMYERKLALHEREDACVRS